MSIYFDSLDAVAPLTPAMTKTMLEEAFACGHETIDHDKAHAIACNITRIQENSIRFRSVRQSRVERRVISCHEWIQMQIPTWVSTESLRRRA